MRHALASLLLIATAALAAACSNATPSAGRVERITSTTSFGMCAGYCRTSLEITHGQAVLVREPGGRGGAELQPQRETLTLSEAEWQELVELAEGTSFDGLPETIGCPDCADGGAESLAVAANGHEHKVTFDHGADIKALQPLLNRVRELRKKLMPRDQ